jgi:molybdate-binding protein
VGAIVLITLARWEVGLVVRTDDARPVRTPADLARPGLRLVGREAGAGAQRVLEQAVREQGLPIRLARHPHLKVSGHLDIGRAIAMGAADTGVATRDAALAFGLGFVALAEERYDLALPRAGLAEPRVQRLLDMLVSGEFRRDLSALGYDVRAAGERVAEVQAA